MRLKPVNMLQSLDSISIYSNGKAVLIACMNTFSSNKSYELKVHEIFKEGFSTKGEERGLGLSILRQMVDASPKLRLNTKINGNLFIQELFIEEEGVNMKVIICEDNVVQLEHIKNH